MGIEVDGKGLWERDGEQNVSQFIAQLRGEHVKARGCQCRQDSDCLVQRGIVPPTNVLLTPLQELKTVIIVKKM